MDFNAHYENQSLGTHQLSNEKKNTTFFEPKTRTVPDNKYCTLTCGKI